MVFQVLRRLKPIMATSRPFLIWSSPWFFQRSFCNFSYLSSVVIHYKPVWKKQVIFEAKYSKYNKGRHQVTRQAESKMITFILPCIFHRLCSLLRGVWHVSWSLYVCCPPCDELNLPSTTEKQGKQSVTQVICQTSACKWAKWIYLLLYMYIWHVSPCSCTAKIVVRISHSFEASNCIRHEACKLVPLCFTNIDKTAQNQLYLN